MLILVSLAGMHKIMQLHVTKKANMFFYLVTVRLEEIPQPVRVEQTSSKAPGFGPRW